MQLGASDEEGDDADGGGGRCGRGRGGRSASRPRAAATATGPAAGGGSSGRARSAPARASASGGGGGGGGGGRGDGRACRGPFCARGCPLPVADADAGLTWEDAARHQALTHPGSFTPAGAAAHIASAAAEGVDVGFAACCTRCGSWVHSNVDLRTAAHNSRQCFKAHTAAHACPHDGCGYTATTVRNLNRHVAGHAAARETFPCTRVGEDGCTNNNGKGFTAKLGLKVHIQNIHEGVVYPCTVVGCTRGAAAPFSMAAGLHKHMKEVHGAGK